MFWLGCETCAPAGPLAISVQTRVELRCRDGRYGTLEANSKGIFAGEARSLPGCVNSPSAPVCELGIFSLSVAEMPQWDAFQKSLDEVDNPAGALS